MFKKILPFQKKIGENKKYFYSYFVLMTVLVLINIYQLLVNRQLLDSLIDKKPLEEVIKYLVIYTVLVFAILGIEYINGKLKAIFTETMKHEGKKTIVQNLRMSDSTKFKTLDAAYISQRLESDFSQILNFYVEVLVPAITRGLNILLAIVITFTVNIYIGIFFILFMPIVYFIYKKYSAKMFDYASSYRTASANYFNDLNGQIEHIDEIVQSGEYEKETNYFDFSFKSFFKTFMKFTKLNLRFDFVISGLGMFISVMVIVYSAIQVFRGSMTIGDLILLLNFTANLLSGTLSYANLAKEKKQSEVSVKQVNDYYSSAKVKEGTKTVDNIGVIESKLSYSFDGEKRLYSDLDLKFETGNIYGILGDNGSGKSTLYKILTGVIKPNEFSELDVRVNGESLSEIDSINLRKNNLYVVTQTPRTYLKDVNDYFKFTFNLENLDMVYKKLKDNSIETKGVIEPFLNLNWNKKIKDLSGGDRQFLFIIGSMISDKSLLIYDEPTANLDQNRKKWFLQSLKIIKDDAIVIMITHDKDCALVFDKSYRI